MGSTIIVSQEHRNKEQVLKKIIEFGNRNKFKIIPKEKTLSLGDIALSKEIGEDDYNYLEFSVTEKDEFKTEITNSSVINGKRYYFYIWIDHTSNDQVYHSMNEFFNEILSDYPDMLVTDEACKNFYSIEQIKNKQVPKWLLI
ncbi:hypothetical protein ASG38_16270 [Flavobacterium sp. Leaf359]|jgi:hypothetical protein|uniref:hypothetical protein n=1 Tax=Flavobacterium sp. Leaf359 TaxID=1736351 RepID=UPI0007021599|nr:hypothetical protein [Flavobacterium sp. Leaf359]KQS52690.1 hypothetical protein ASG38_16270 [Flavobacterium sp. Leaf359]